MSAPSPTPALSIVIPAWNEEARIGRTLDATLAFLDATKRDAEVLVVDDGSVDRTAALVAERAAIDPRLRLVRLEANRGKGAAVRTGVLQSKGARVLFMDADLATPIEEIVKLERALDEGADVAIGSRALPDSEIVHRQHPLRELMGKTFNVLVRAMLLGGFKDTQCGFKLFSREAADTLFGAATLDRFAFDVELLLLARGRFRVVDRAVVWRHVDMSKVSPFRDASRMALDIARIRVRLAIKNPIAPRRAAAAK